MYEILRNPKYTGYQVFNRRASRSKGGKVNDPVKWVWSPKPVHEPLIPKWMYDESNARREARRGSRADNEPNVHPQTRRTYMLRGMVFCGCGRRMFGTHRHNTAYYMCWPKNNNRGRPDTYAGHPKAIYLREPSILDAVSQFLADRVFGPRRRAILAADLDGLDDRAAQQRHADRERLHRVLSELTRRQTSVLRQAQDGEPDDPFTQGLRTTYNELEAQKKTTQAAIADVDAADEADPGKPSEDDLALLGTLPFLTMNLADAPEKHLRSLFEALQLTVGLIEDTDKVTIEIRLPADELAQIAVQAERTSKTMRSTRKTPGQREGSACVDAVRAPGEIRTHTGRVLNPLPLPVGLRGPTAGRLYASARSRDWVGPGCGLGVAPATSW
ncbi:hypothetical protein GCM10022222_78620 [Amycolatopsis ultiminotia]|uniref:Recombinase n=1 Tax=Amycolatopsis ultiminotia TaxID=543629 RepID=A0ABP6YEE9_9PSEU